MKALFPDVVVNGEEIPHAAVAAEAQNHAAPKGKPGIAWRKAANALAIRTLLLQEARRRELSPECNELAPGRTETKEEALIRSLLEAEVATNKPTDVEIREFWARDPERFRAPPLWEASHILCACDPRDQGAREKAYTRAKAITEQVNGNPATFGLIAERESDCGSKTNGGKLGQIAPGQTTPEFEKVLRNLSEGEITSEPELTRHGYHVVRVDAVIDGRVLPFNAVQTKISDAIEKSRWASAAQDLVKALAAGATITGANLDPV
ncbi:MAG: peptidylprolyl isomerase [Boseongicola sp.]